MARQARRHSNTGIYHVMLRGINRQDLFHEESDYLFFLERLHLLAHPKDERNEPASPFCDIYAYCLMHETNEQSFLQNPNFFPSDSHRVFKAHGSAESIEHSYTGNIGVENVLEINKENTGYLVFHKDNRVIEKKQINHGNCK